VRWRRAPTCNPCTASPPILECGKRCLRVRQEARPASVRRTLPMGAPSSKFAMKRGYRKETPRCAARPIIPRAARARWRFHHSQPLGSRYRETAGDARLRSARHHQLGLANMPGRADSVVMRGEVITNCRDTASATELPVNADLENCFRARRRPQTEAYLSPLRSPLCCDVFATIRQRQQCR
jgi:hypothetical protein